MIIYRNTSVIYDLDVDENVSYQRRLMGEDKVIATLVCETALSLQIGDYIKIGQVRYTMNRPAKCTKIKSVEFSYVITFEAPVYRLLDKRYMLNDRSEFPLVGTLADFADLLIENINTIDVGWTVGTVNTTAGTIRKLINFNNSSCRAILNILCDTYFCEYVINNKQISFYDRIETETNLVFEHGKGNGLYQLACETVDDENTVTRLYGFGSNKNIPLSYRNGEPRLIFDVAGKRYIQNISEYGRIVENSKTFDEIYPHLEATVTDVTPDGLNIKSTNLNFNLNNQFVTGDTAKVVFLTGDLMAQEFEIASYNDSKKTITIKTNTLSGSLVPNAMFMPKIGDVFTIVNIEMPTAYITEAENLLWTMTDLWLSYFCKLRVKYSLVLDYRYIRDSAISLHVGDLVTINDSSLEIDSLKLRITSLTSNLAGTELQADISNYRDELWEKALVQNIGNTIRQIQNITNTTNEGNTEPPTDLRTVLISGVVAWDHDLTFRSTVLVYKIVGVDYMISPQTVVLDNADGTNPRIDIFFVDATSHLQVRKGTPAAIPVKPAIGANELEVTQVLIPAGSSAPQLTKILVYDENNINTEWAQTETHDTNIAQSLVSTAQPFFGTKHIRTSISIPDTVVNSPTHYIGETYQGGIIFHIERGGKTGHIAGTMSLGSSFYESLSNDSPYTTGATGQEIGTGKPNSVILSAHHNAQKYAIKFINNYEKDGYSDWFMGSVNEMKQLAFRKQFFPSLKGTFWSSTENGWDKAQCIVMETGGVYSRDKNNSYQIVPVRSFDDSTLTAGDPVEKYTPTQTVLTFTPPEAIDLTNGIVSFYLRTSKEWLENTNLAIEFLNGTARTGIVNIANQTYGFNHSLTDWQLIGVQVSQIGLTTKTLTSIKVSFTGSWPNNITIDIDRFIIQYDPNQSIPVVPAGTYGDEKKNIRLTFDTAGNMISAEELEFGNSTNFTFKDIATSDGQYTLVLKSDYEYKLTKLSVKVDTGTVTATVRINGVGVTGMTDIVITSTLTDFLSTANFNVPVDGEVELVITSKTGLPTTMKGQIYFL